MNFETLLKLKEYKSPHFFHYDGNPIITDSGHIISELLIAGYEDNTLLITEDYQYINSSFKGIISENILSFKEL